MLDRVNQTTRAKKRTMLARKVARPKDVLYNQQILPQRESSTHHAQPSTFQAINRHNKPRRVETPHAGSNHVGLKTSSHEIIHIYNIAKTKEQNQSSQAHHAHRLSAREDERNKWARENHDHRKREAKLRSIICIPLRE